MKRCLVMQHVAFEDLGTFAPVLEEKGFAIRYCPVDEPPTEEEWLAADLAVVLGGAIGVYDQVLYPFLKDEKDLIRKRLESQKPLLGICLGAQLIASVLKSPGRERGEQRHADKARHADEEKLHADVEKLIAPLFHVRTTLYPTPRIVTILKSGLSRKRSRRRAMWTSTVWVSVLES